MNFSDMHYYSFSFFSELLRSAPLRISYILLSFCLLITSGTLSGEEYEAFNRKFTTSGMKSRSDFFRHMIFKGYIVKFNDDELKELLKLARSISNNFNQVAVRANSGGKVYPEDISALREEVDKLWQPLRFFQSQLMSLHH